MEQNEEGFTVGLTLPIKQEVESVWRAVQALRSSPLLLRGASAGLFESNFESGS